MHSLDTNICIALLKGDSEAVERLRLCNPGELAVCSVVRAELYFGARKSDRLDRNLALLARFLEPFRSLPFDDASSQEYGLLRATLERAGQPIGGNDLLIASIAIAHDCTLVTRNYREFARVPGLRVEVWGRSLSL